jgi:hypothetical protein
MNPRIFVFLVPLLGPVVGCSQPWPDFVTCEEAKVCEATEGTSSTGTQTTGGGVQTVTGDSGETDASGGSSESGGESGDEASGGTTGEGVSVPIIGAHAITPDYTDVNTVLAVTVAAEQADGVRMQIGDGEPIELTQVSPGEFIGEIPAFTGLDNGQFTAVLTPWDGASEGEAVLVDYVVALPPPGYERYWQASSLGVSGHVAAVDVLPDGRPVEFGTYDDNGTPRCFLRLRETDGAPGEFLPVLPTAHCRANDLTIDSETGVIHVLIERKGGDGEVWWVGEMAAWGLGLVNVGTGVVGETATALARHPGMVAVCGSKQVDTTDERDALAVLLRPNEQAEVRLFDYVPAQFPPHEFAETVRDCKFSGDTLVLVGQAWGKHGLEIIQRDRLALVEVDVLVSDDAKWNVAGPGSDVQSRGLALDVDDEGRYHVAGYTCADDCEPDGEVRVYEPGGVLASQVQLGLLGSLWLGPHDIAWSPAGYAVVALGELQGQDLVFKVVAVAPGKPEALWTFTPNDKQGQQLGLAVAVGPHGEVYAGGMAKDDRPAFAVVGG